MIIKHIPQRYNFLCRQAIEASGGECTTSDIVDYILLKYTTFDNSNRKNFRNAIYNNMLRNPKFFERLGKGVWRVRKPS